MNVAQGSMIMLFPHMLIPKQFAADIPRHFFFAIRKATHNIVGGPLNKKFNYAAELIAIF